jgi:hypothetical protein
LTIIRAVDEAEAEGDAYRALDLIEADVQRRPDTETFWSAERLTQLMQLVLFRSVLPGWAISRWILGQAARSVEPSRRQRHVRAFDRTVQIAGGPERYRGADDFDSSCKLMDHDWVYRQLLLYEYGGLLHFIDGSASPELVASADNIRQWVTAPMGAFRLMDRSSTSLRWLDLSSGQEVTTANIGSASLLEVDEHAIGRLVPTEAGPMFESAPIFVPPDVAGWVAHEPLDWPSALERGCRREAPLGLRISTQTSGFPMLSDVPVVHRRALVESVVGPEEGRWSVDDLREAYGAVVRAATAERPRFSDVPFDPWPVVGSLVLDPEVAVDCVLGHCVVASSGFDRLARRLASPAAEVCRVLALPRRPGGEER